MTARDTGKSVGWKRPAVMAVMVATMLCASGLVLAIRQANAAFQLKLEDLRFGARAKIEEIRDLTFKTASRAINIAAAEVEIAPDRITASGWPAWLGYPYLWTDWLLEPLKARLDDRIRYEAVFGTEAELHRRMRMILNDPFPQGSLSTDAALFVPLALPPDDSAGFIVLRTVTVRGSTKQLFAIIDGRRLLQDINNRLALNINQLSLVTQDPGLPNWDLWIGSEFPGWALVPAPGYLAELREERNTQIAVNVGATLAALLALVGVVGGLVQTARREASLARLKGDFVAAVSHELKTPLALIRMFAETLQDGRVTHPDKAKEYYGIIVHESNRLTHMIDNILEFSRSEAGSRSFRKQLLDIGPVVQRTYDVYSIELENDGFRHAVTIDHDLPQVEADADAISQAVLNLMSNAAKYSDEEKSIELTVTKETRRGRHGVLISVFDSGIGIRPEDRAQLFDGFFRGTDERVRAKRGAGLGLAVVKQIVDAHGGIVEAEPRLIKGSAFRIFLPGPV